MASDEANVGRGHGSGRNSPVRVDCALLGAQEAVHGAYYAGTRQSYEIRRAWELAAAS